jgi:hypothetical protein
MADMVQLILKFRVAPVMTAAVALATSALAQAIAVTGTGNPNVDVPAVQVAVNLGGDVVLSGHFFLRHKWTYTFPETG